MIRNLIPVITALIVCTIFLVVVLAPGGSGFNFIPYQVHESISAGSKDETSFIKLFDVVAAVLLFMIVYRIVAIMLRKRRTK